jgi:hypothetical protein
MELYLESTVKKYLTRKAVAKYEKALECADKKY